MLEIVDLLCNKLPHTRAKDIRLQLKCMNSSLEDAKAETVDGLMEQVKSQQQVISRQQHTISILEAQLSQYLVLASSSVLPSPLSLPENSDTLLSPSLQSSFVVREGRASTDEQKRGSVATGRGSRREGHGGSLALVSLALPSSPFSLPEHSDTLVSPSLQSSFVVREGRTSTEEQKRGIMEADRGDQRGRGKVRQCRGCGKSLLKSDFSKTQLRNSQGGGLATCLSCVMLISPVPSTGAQAGMR